MTRPLLPAYLCLFTAIFLIAACSGEASKDTPPTPTGAPAEVIFPGDQAPLNEVFSFTVHVGDRKLVSVNADMPSHGHGINTEPEWSKLEDGSWQVDGMLFHMPGAWELYFDVIGSDGAEERIVYPVELGFE